MKDLRKQEHYTNNGIEPIEIMRKNFSHDEFVGFCKGNVLKYLLRYKDKNGLEDLEKAKIYLNWLIDELVVEDLNETFDERFEEIEREEQEKCSCGCHCEDYKGYEGCEGNKGFGVQLTLFNNEPTEELSIVSTNDFKEADLSDENCEEPSDFEKFLAWKQTLNDWRKGE